MIIRSLGATRWSCCVVPRKKWRSVCPELRQIPLSHLLHGHLLCTIKAKTIPKERSGLPVQDLHLAFSARHISTTIREAIGHLRDELERPPPSLLVKQLALVHLASHGGNLLRIPFPIFLLPDKIQNLGRFFWGQVTCSSCQKYHENVH